MEKTKPNSKPKRIIDPDDYDWTLDIHDDPIRHPPIPYTHKYRDEFNINLDAFWCGFIKKDNPDDYTEYWQAWNAYENTTTYKRQINAYERYKERLALLIKRHETDPNRYLQILIALNEERSNKLW